MSKGRTRTRDVALMANLPAAQPRTIHRVVFAIIAVLVFIADQVTKNVVRTSIPDRAVIPIIPGFFNLTHTENSGMAFSLLSNSSSPWKMVLLIAVSIVLLITVAAIVWRSREIHWGAGIGLALVLGGAVANLVDRIRYGQVIDFLDVYYRSYHWPTFNFADSAIVVGAALLILEMFFSK